MRPETDPILLDIIEGTIESAVSEMELAVERTARSVVLREQHDYRAAINDRAGRSVSRVSFAATIDCILEKYPIDQMEDGDVFLYNDPYLSHGGVGHLPDMCVIRPVVHQGDVIAFVQMFGHCEDVGGLTMGSMIPTATSIFQEGVMVPPIRLYRRGEINEEAYEIILRNSRMPESLRGDIDAEIAATRIGRNRLVELCQRYGKGVVLDLMEALLERCTRAIKGGVLPLIPNGEGEFEDFIEFDGVIPDKPYKIKVMLRKTEEEIVFDFNGTSEQAAGAINWPATDKYYARILSAIFKGLLPGLVINEGAVDVVRVVAPPAGTLLNPIFPAPTSNRTRAMLRLSSVISGVLAKVVRGMVPADSNLITTYGVHGRDTSGRPFFFREILGGGSGARPYADGNDAVDVVPESKNVPAEFAETMFPVLIKRLALYRDSGGPGKYRGGLGYEKDFVVYADGKLTLNADRTRFACWGLEGGKAGKCGGAIISPGTAEERIVFGNVDNVPIRKGDVIRIRTSGGGGWGDPLDRDPYLVASDVLRGLVSPESARNDYGVAADLSDGGFDETETERLRTEFRRRRPPLRLFDRGEHAEMLITKGIISVSNNPALSGGQDDCR